MRLIADEPVVAADSLYRPALIFATATPTLGALGSLALPTGRVHRMVAIKEPFAITEARRGCRSYGVNSANPPVGMTYATRCRSARSRANGAILEGPVSQSAAKYARTFPGESHMKIVSALGTSAVQMRGGRAGGRKAKTSVSYEGVSARDAGTPPCLVPSPPCSA